MGSLAAFQTNPAVVMAAQYASNSTPARSGCWAAKSCSQVAYSPGRPVAATAHFQDFCNHGSREVPGSSSATVGPS
ncbi:hypothetical protein [Nocardia seriolae]|uniref:hypothetical protein n=1 Tax=Nocardia seriolae TaxID=37332 RepID=UPI0013789215|nr:hypothetical protein [Nocardia seriolae]QOW35128.1 hypothetical protein IMZ23_09205 [Nocardia seriolae]